MSPMKDKHEQAADRYIAAVAEFRAARADLAAYDRLMGSPSFGPAPDPIPFRHAMFAPDVGSFADAA